MKKLLLSISLFFLYTLMSYGQENSLGLGFYGDVRLDKNPKVDRGVFGIQAIYDFEGHHGIQGQVYGRADFVSAGADYIFNFLDKGESDFNVFAGLGGAVDFYRVNVLNEQNITKTIRENEGMVNALAGVSYYFREVGLSVYTGYKARGGTVNKDRLIHSNHVMFGFRYHLWGNK